MVRFVGDICRGTQSSCRRRRHRAYSGVRGRAGASAEVGISFARRPAGPGDLAFAYGLYRHLMEPLTVAYRAWDDARQRRIVAEAIAAGEVEVIALGERDVGWVQVRETDDAVILGQLYVLPAFQGRGIGTAVVRDVLAGAGARGRPVDLAVLGNNDRARALYERLGFRRVREDGVKIHLRWG
jgi:ribosomal protein S18 acetylase RimI-like enzyme